MANTGGKAVKELDTLWNLWYTDEKNARESVAGPDALPSFVNDEKRGEKSWLTQFMKSCTRLQRRI